jgi:hypothetical protein
VADGRIVGRTSEGTPNSFRVTEQAYGDFELEFEVRVDDALNSGVQMCSRTSQRSTLEPMMVPTGLHSPLGTTNQCFCYRMNSGVAKLGIRRTTVGQTITRARTASIGISMIIVSLSASVMRMPAIAQAIRRQRP